MKTAAGHRDESLRTALKRLREARRSRQDTRRSARPRRRSLASKARALVLAKTAGRCHICGDEVGSLPWQADHVLAHADGGAHSVDNYLAAHALCNNYRWDYSAEEFQWILKIGVWARTQIEKPSALGDSMLAAFAASETRRIRRRRS